MATTLKKFVFCDSENEEEQGETLTVFIPAVLDARFGMYVWPCAPVLAQYVWYHRSKVQGQRVLELGSGTALPGVVAAKMGAMVTLSDACQLPDCQSNSISSCEVNGIDSVRVIGLTWGQFSPDLLKLPPQDVILASDCFYDTKDFEDVLVTVRYLLNKNKEAQFWTTYQVRSSGRSLEPLLHKWDMQCELVPLDSFGAEDTSVAESDLPGNHTIEMLIIKTDS